MRARALASLCRGTFKVLEIIWPMKTIILNVLLQITHNILTFCKMCDSAFKQGRICWMLGHLKTCLIFLGLLLSKSSVLFKTILSWSCSKPVGAKSVPVPVRLCKSQISIIFDTQNYHCKAALHHTKFIWASIKHPFVSVEFLKWIDSSRHSECWEQVALACSLPLLHA